MNTPEFFVGIDMASASFTVSAGQVRDGRWVIVAAPVTFPNQYDSFAGCLHHLHQHHLRPDNAVVCMEATGVYSEALAHFLVANHYRLAIDPPLKVKRAFKPEGHKSEPVDSRQIAEYAYRYYDQLTFWQPRQELLEQIKVLLATREQFVTQVTAHRNHLRALQRKVVRTPLAEQLHEDAIAQLRSHIDTLEQEIERLIDQDPTWRQMVGLLVSIPGVGLLLAAHLLVVLQAAPQPPSAKQLAAYVGVCPYEHTSGTSVYGPPTSRHYGPPALRKLLYLAALSLRRHHPQFRIYFLRKVAEGKPKKLVINNIINKLLKIICAIWRSQTPFIPNYRSVNPRLLKKTLTVS